MSSGSVSEHLRAGAPAADQVPARMPGIADPVPVGIAGFAMTTFILSCINAGFFGGTAATPMVLGLAIVYGGWCSCWPACGPSAAVRRSSRWPSAP